MQKTCVSEWDLQQPMQGDWNANISSILETHWLLHGNLNYQSFLVVLLKSCYIPGLQSWFYIKIKNSKVEHHKF